MVLASKRGFVIWLTGLPAAGKTTISKILVPEIGGRVERLDGDEVRTWLSPQNGFSRADREIHLKRVAHICHLLARNGVVVIASFVSPYKSTRDYARSVIGDFVEVYVKCSIGTCMKRDPKGLYKMASEGKISNMTGTQDAYEEPETPEIVVETEKLTAEGAADVILKKLQMLGLLVAEGPRMAQREDR